MNSLFTLTLFLTLALNSGAVVTGQQRSRTDALKEAARLATEAERLQSQKLAAENFEKAIELWREAGDDKRLRAGVEELTRIYSVIGDYERVLDRLTREAQYWEGRGKVAEQTDTLYLLGTRQWQMKRDATAIETLERVVAMSRSARLRSLEPNALTQLAMLYERAGRAKDAESARASANKAWPAASSEPPPMANPIPPATIPAQWVDLPGAPAAAEYRVIAGVNEAVLVNRTSKGIVMVRFGCVALDDNKKARTLYGLIGYGMTHGGVRPGSYYEPFLTLNGPLNRWTDEKMGCEGAAKMTLIEAQFDDKTIWKADGANWVP